MKDSGMVQRLFADLSGEDSSAILSVCEPRVLAGGEDLFHENDPGDSLWIVESGRVEVVKHIRAGVDRTLASVGAGEVIGEMSFIDGSRRSAGARTAEPSEFQVLTRVSFARIQKDRPEVAAAFYRNLAVVMAERLRMTTDLYRESVAFGIEATGAGALSLKSLMEELRPVTIDLGDGNEVSGRILQIDRHAAGHTIVLKTTDERITIIPYHAIRRIDL